MNIVLYMRMSTDKQENSIDSQQKILQTYADTHKMKIISKYIDEGISGRTAEKRPAFMQMMEDSSKRLFDAVLIYDSSRFARNLEESIVYKSELRRNGVQLISATEPTLDDDSALITDAMLGALNEMYSRKLSKAVKRGMLHKSEKGIFQVPPPYGYVKANGITNIADGEAEVVKMMFQSFVEHPSYRSVSCKLNQLGIKPRRGGSWESNDIKRLLKNRAYIGDVFYSGNYYKGQHEPIIEPALFDEVQELIKVKPVGKSRSEMTYRHWLSGIMRCDYCGCRMNYTQNTAGCEGYKCSGRDKDICITSNYIGLKNLEKLIKYELDNFTNNKELLDYEYFINKKSFLTEIDAFQQALKRADSKLDRCKKAYTNGIDSLDEYRKNKLAITEERSEILKQIEALERDERKEEELEFLSGKAVKLSDLIFSDYYSIEQKNLALKNIISKIVINKKEGIFNVYYFF